nr:hypothetical protein [Tanacetum cinerariifolium]
MTWFLRCSWCEGPFNGENYRRCINVSFGDEFVLNLDPISYDETSDFSYPPPQPQTYSCELCGNDSHYGYDCPPRLVHNEWIKSHNDMIESRNELLKTMQSSGKMLRQQKQAANLSTHTPEPSRRFNSICYDDVDDKESTILLQSHQSYRLWNLRTLSSWGRRYDENDAFLDIDVSMDIKDDYHDSERDIIYLECLLGYHCRMYPQTNEPNFVPPEVFLDHDPKSLNDEPILMI